MSIMDDFLYAIHNKRIVKIKAKTDERGIIVRHSVPFDYGSGKLPGVRFHFWNLDGPEGPHNFSVLPKDLLSLEVTEKTFEPRNYVTWNPPYKWHIQRDWEDKS